MRTTILGLVITAALTAHGWAQTTPPVSASGNPTVAANRATALDLSYRGRNLDALPMLETLSKALPNDAIVWERYAVGLYATSATLTNPDEARQMRIKAKEAFNRTRELGNNSPLAMLGDSMPADGSIPPLAAAPEAQAAMSAGEAAFARRDFPTAVAQYQAALKIDPTNYNATLFIGDAYYAQKNTDKAAEWFARAIVIAPNVETAHRYWGDVMLQAGKPLEARNHFIDALIAQPYTQDARTGLSQWAQVTGARIGTPAVRPASAPQGAAARAWAAYSAAQARWRSEEFLRQYPNERVYRHSLAEEIDAFNALLAVAAEITDAADAAARAELQSNQQVMTIRALRDRGFLEPYVLLHAADAGIAQDYDAYRAAHREKLQAYMESMIVTAR